MVKHKIILPEDDSSEIVSWYHFGIHTSMPSAHMASVLNVLCCIDLAYKGKWEVNYKLNIQVSYGYFIYTNEYGDIFSLFQSKNKLKDFLAAGTNFDYIFSVNHIQEEFVSRLGQHLKISFVTHLPEIKSKDFSKYLQTISTH
ncbi:MAG: hypothetical protein MUE53_00585 [Chitinophagales bacterium]|jgi:hypothetical protein|nr:hypothetical protein [Chitinophagales bacterium]